MHRATIFLQDFFTIDNTRPLAIIFFHQNKRPSPIKGPLLKIRLQDPLNVLRENSSPVHYWCAYGMYHFLFSENWLPIFALLGLRKTHFGALWAT